jgi:hypothetical protein
MAHAARPSALVALLVAFPAAAQGPRAVPDRLAPFELRDQHGERRAVDASVRVLLLTRDMEGGAVVRGALERKGAEAGAFLAERGAVYVADVSRMPRLLRTLFAIPRMRGRPYPVLLDETGEATSALPSEAGRATVLWLVDLRPVRAELVDSPDALLAKLGETSASAPGALPGGAREGSEVERR